MEKLRGNDDHQTMKPVPFTNVVIEDDFWTLQMKSNKEVTIEACLDRCEETGRIANFVKAAGFMDGEFEGIYYNDSDVYKVIEGVAYSLMLHPDPKLEARSDKVIDFIVAAQLEDGYLNTYHTLTDLNKRWTDMNHHEAYCAGHLIEAAVAYYQATNKRKLLDTAIHFADHMCDQFGTTIEHWVAGHEEIELALVKLYQVTKNDRYWRLAYWFLEERGTGHGEGLIWEKEDFGAVYVQDDTPVSGLNHAVGHSVRAMYLYSGMADIAVLTKHQPYIDALNRVWDNIVNRKMYVTGGIGSSAQNEGFTEDYDLPNREAYCETCAAVGMVLWNHRMNLIHRDAKYADVLEKSLYNGALAGVSLSGDKFFYDNPLSSVGDRHRVKWFDCSCCPTQVSRFIPSVGNYVYGLSDSEVWVNTYIGNSASVLLNDGEVEITQKTNYPWEGKVELLIETKQPLDFTINLRVPEWCRNKELFLNGDRVEQQNHEKGYLKITKNWQSGDQLVFDMKMAVERVYSDPKVLENQGKVAIQRGPLVYCMEQVDHSYDIQSFSLSKETSFQIEHQEGLLNGVTLIKGIDCQSGKSFTFVPYHVWDNRDPGAMDVWLNESI